jgi:hypothetical protein
VSKIGIILFLCQVLNHNLRHEDLISNLNYTSFRDLKITILLILQWRYRLTKKAPKNLDVGQSAVEGTPPFFGQMQP